jgi:hypothetical protein
MLLGAKDKPQILGWGAEVTRRRIAFSLAQYGWLWLLFGALSWGQVGGSRTMPPTQNSDTAITAATKSTTQAGTSNVDPDTPIITIDGLCDKPQEDKAAVFDCKTVITRARFETLIVALQPNMTARARREFAARYADALVMARKAEQMGLDKGADFEEEMKVARLQALSQELKKAIQREASQISDKDIELYYENNASSFEQVEMDRIYIPKSQELPILPNEVLSDADKRKQLQHAEQVMKETADKLRVRAIAEEDFSTLQTDAFKIAGIKSNAGSSIGKIRRISLPPSQRWVMDLKPGEVSSVIVDPNAYIIYKVKTKTVIPLDQAREEIKGILRSQRMQSEMREIEDSATTTLDEGYFGPEGPHKE